MKNIINFTFQYIDGAVGLVIPPTLVIEHQMEKLMTTWGIKFLHLCKIEAVDLAITIKREKPSILLTNIE